MMTANQPTDLFHLDGVGSAPRQGRWDQRCPDAERRIAQWSDADETRPPIPGLGFRSGENLVFARSTREDRTQGGIGLVDYVLEATGDLAATWVHPALGPQIGSGNATRTKGDRGGFAGTFEIVYYDAGGAQAGPACALMIERTEAAWSLTWFKSAGNRLLFEGVGLEADGRLVAAWGPPGEPRDLVVLRPGDDGALLGRCIAKPAGAVFVEAWVSQRPEPR